MVGQARDIARWLSKRRGVIAAAAALWAVFKVARWPVLLAWDLLGSDGAMSVLDYGRHHVALVVLALLAVGAIAFGVVYRSLGWLGDQADSSPDPTGA